MVSTRLKRVILKRGGGTPSQREQYKRDIEKIDKERAKRLSSQVTPIAEDKGKGATPSPSSSKNKVIQFVKDGKTHYAEVPKDATNIEVVSTNKGYGVKYVSGSSKAYEVKGPYGEGYSTQQPKETIEQVYFRSPKKDRISRAYEEQTGKEVYPKNIKTAINPVYTVTGPHGEGYSTQQPKETIEQVYPKQQKTVKKVSLKEEAAKAISQPSYISQKIARASGILPEATGDKISIKVNRKGIRTTGIEWPLPRMIAKAGEGAVSGVTQVATTVVNPKGMFGYSERGEALSYSERASMEKKKLPIRERVAFSIGEISGTSGMFSRLGYTELYPASSRGATFVNPKTKEIRDVAEVSRRQTLFPKLRDQPNPVTVSYAKKVKGSYEGATLTLNPKVSITGKQTVTPTLKRIRVPTDRIRDTFSYSNYIDDVVQYTDDVGNVIIENPMATVKGYTATTETVDTATKNFDTVRSTYQVLTRSDIPNYASMAGGSSTAGSTGSGVSFTRDVYTLGNKMYFDPTTVTKPPTYDIISKSIDGTTLTSQKLSGGTLKEAGKVITSILPKPQATTSIQQATGIAAGITATKEATLPKPTITEAKTTPETPTITVQEKSTTKAVTETQTAPAFRETTIQTPKEILTPRLRITPAVNQGAKEAQKQTPITTPQAITIQSPQAIPKPKIKVIPTITPTITPIERQTPAFTPAITTTTSTGFTIPPSPTVGGPPIPPAYPILFGGGGLGGGSVPFPKYKETKAKKINILKEVFGGK